MWLCSLRDTDFCKIKKEEEFHQTILRKRRTLNWAQNESALSNIKISIIEYQDVSKFISVLRIDVAELAQTCPS